MTRHPVYLLRNGAAATLGDVKFLKEVLGLEEKTLREIETTSRDLHPGVRLALIEPGSVANLDEGDFP